MAGVWLPQAPHPRGFHQLMWLPQPPWPPAPSAAFPGSLFSMTAADRRHRRTGSGRRRRCSQTTQLALSSTPITVSAWLGFPPCVVNTPNLSQGPEVTAEPINLNQSILRVITPHTELLSMSAVCLHREADGLAVFRSILFFACPLQELVWGGESRFPLGE